MKGAKQKAVMAERSKQKWGEIFSQLGGTATTTMLGVHTGRSSPSILVAMHNLEKKGLVRRVGSILRGGNRISQIVWGWCNAD